MDAAYYWLCHETFGKLPGKTEHKFARELRVGDGILCLCAIVQETYLWRPEWRRALDPHFPWLLPPIVLTLRRDFPLGINVGIYSPRSPIFKINISFALFPQTSSHNYQEYRAFKYSFSTKTSSLISESLYEQDDTRSSKSLRSVNWSYALPLFHDLYLPFELFCLAGLIAVLKFCLMGMCNISR